MLICDSSTGDSPGLNCLLQTILAVLYIILLFYSNRIILRKFSTPLGVVIIRFAVTYTLIIFGMKFGVHLSTPIRIMSPVIITIIFGGSQVWIQPLILASSVMFAYIIILLVGKDSRINWKRFFYYDWDKENKEIYF